MSAADGETNWMFGDGGLDSLKREVQDETAAGRGKRRGAERALPESGELDAAKASEQPVVIEAPVTPPVSSAAVSSAPVSEVPVSEAPVSEPIAEADEAELEDYEAGLDEPYEMGLEDLSAAAAPHEVPDDDLEASDEAPVIELGRGDAEPQDSTDEAGAADHDDDAVEPDLLSSDILRGGPRPEPATTEASPAVEPVAETPPAPEPEPVAETPPAPVAQTPPAPVAQTAPAPAPLAQSPAATPAPSGMEIPVKPSESSDDLIPLSMADLVGPSPSEVEPAVVERHVRIPGEPRAATEAVTRPAPAAPSGSADSFPVEQSESRPASQDSDPELEEIDPAELLRMIDQRPPREDSGPQPAGGEAAVAEEVEEVSHAANDGDAVASESVNVRRVIETRSEQMTLRGLARRGVKNVRVLDMSVINNIMTDAVETCLDRMSATLTAGQRDELERDAKREFYELLEEHKRVVAEKDELTEAKLKLNTQVDSLKSELDRQREMLEAENKRHDQLGQATFSANSFDQMESFIRGAFRKLMTEESRRTLAEYGPKALSGLSAFERELGSMLDTLLMREREKAISEEQEVHAQRVQILEARIKKLSSALGNTETALKKVAAMKQIDGGVASVYELVQGLSLDDDYFEKKSELLKTVFVENLELQGREVTQEDLDGTYAGPPPKVNPVQELELPEGFEAPLESLTGETGF